MAQLAHLRTTNNSTESPAARFITISMQRSATTTFTALLAQHPLIYSMSEILNVGWATKQMPRALVQLIQERLPNVTTHTQLIEQLPAVVRLVWSWCDGGPDERRRDGRLHCGFKVFEEHLLLEHKQPLELLPPPPGSKTALVVQLLRLYRASSPHMTTPLTMILERRNVTAGYESWRRAVTTNDWGTTPAAHEAWRGAHELVAWPSTMPSLQSSPEAILSSRGYPIQSLAHYAHEHAVWFARARATARHAGSRVLELSTEALLENPVREMARVEAFLGVAPHAQYTMPISKRTRDATSTTLKAGEGRKVDVD